MDTKTYRSVALHAIICLLLTALFCCFAVFASATSYQGSAVEHYNGKKVLRSGKTVTVSWSYPSGRTNSFRVYLNDSILISSSQYSGSKTITLLGGEYGVLYSEMMVVGSNGSYNTYRDEIEVIAPWIHNPTAEAVQWVYDDNTKTIVFSGDGAMTNYTSYNYPWYDLVIKNVIVEEGVTTIGNYAFYLKRDIETVSLPSTLTTIGNDAFADCWRLKSITIPNRVKSIGSYAFRYAGIEQLVLPASLKTIGNEAFRNHDLYDITGGRIYTYGLTDVYYKGNQKQWDSISCQRNTNKDLYSARLHFVSYGQATYSWAPDNTSVTASREDISGLQLDETETVNTFYKVENHTAVCSSEAFRNPAFSVQTKILDTVYIPSDTKRIENEAFANIDCQAVIIPDGCEVIGKYAFARASNLVYVRIPGSVEEYPDNAFDGSNESLVIDWLKQD